MSTDPFPAAVLGTARSFTVGTDVFRLASLNGLEWLRAIFSDRYPLSVAPGMLDEASEDLIADKLLDHGGDGKWLGRVAYSALACAGGRPWWETQRLAGALVNARMMGHVLNKGVDIERLNIAQLCACTYDALVSGQDEKGVFTLDAKIQAPPPEAVEEDFPEDDLAAIALSMRNMPGVSVG